MSLPENPPVQLPRDPLKEPKTLEENIAFVIDSDLRPLLTDSGADTQRDLLLIQITRNLNRIDTKLSAFTAKR